MWSYVNDELHLIMKMIIAVFDKMFIVLPIGFFFPIPSDWTATCISFLAAMLLSTQHTLQFPNLINL